MSLLIKWIVGIFSITAMLVMLSACAEEGDAADELNETTIEGEWEITFALRNGSPTTTVDGGVFTFENGSFSSNFIEDGLPGDYELDGETIVTGLRNPEEFHVVSYSDRRMRLKTTISGFDFEFELERITNDDEHIIQ